MKLVKKHLPAGVVVLELSGRVYMGKDCLEIDREVQHHIERNEPRVVFDLTAVDHIDSAFIGQIVKAHSQLSKAGGALRLAGATGMVESSLKLTQVHNVIRVYPTAQQASESFAQS
jgi:anti-anti-sigma factor